MRIGTKKRKELEEYTVHWLAYYDCREMFDGMVIVHTTRRMVECGIDDELRKHAKDLVANILKRLPSKEVE